MNLKINKNQLISLLSIFLFLTTIIYALFLYINWHKTTAESYSLEVSLPVIEWQKYSNLSKQYGNANIKNNHQ